jgi:hypothetical protein
MATDAARQRTIRGAVTLAATCAGVLGVLGGCGPGFQAIYEGNARFEHCYGLEETPQSTMREKGDCWRDWSDHYTYGQTRDRVQYAIARYVALSQAPNVPTDEALMMAAPGVTPRLSTITAPAPTSAFAPPPKVLDQGGGSSGALGTAPAAPAAGAAALAPPTASAPRAPATSAAKAAAMLPGAPCSDGCSAAFRACSDASPKAADDDAKTPKGGATCGDRFKTCMRACYK